MWTSIPLIVSALITGVVTRSVVVEIETCRSEFNRDIMQNVTISLATVGNRKVINGSLIPQIDVRSFDVTTTMKVLQGKDRKITYFNMTFNGCDFVEQPFEKSVSITSFIIHYIRKSVKNLPKRCPIKKFTEVVVSNLYGDTELMPFPMTPKRFEFTTILSTHSTMGARIHVEGVIGEKRKRNG